MRPDSTSRNALHDNAVSALSNQSAASTNYFLVVEAEMDDELKPDSIIPRGRSTMKREVAAQGPIALSSVPSSPVANSTTDAITELSVPNTPPLSGHSRPGSSLSFTSSPRNFSSSSSAIDRDGSIENAVNTRQHIEAYRDLPAGSIGSPVPQFIMPNLHIPRRRPFTDVGRSLGKLRLLVLGSPGTGKTSIIRSISQCCEHIVHIDTFNAECDAPVLEIYASTRPYQWWRTGGSFAALRRRTSSTSVEEILDRNLSFVDFTPQASASILHAVDFVESSLSPLLQKQMADADLISLLSNGGEPTVDAVLYMLSSTGLTEPDTAALSRLQTMTNVIPLLSRSDELDNSGLEDCKRYLRNQIDDLGIDVFSFSPLRELPDQTGIFAVSNATQRENDVMDASTLMSSAYIEPLRPTDLRDLVENIFSVDGASCLRHSAAIKAVKWAHNRNRYHPSDSALTQRAISSGSSGLTLDPFFQMRDWRRLDASSWAQSLRQSLDSERIMSATSSTNPAKGLIPRASGTIAKRRNGHGRSRKRRHTSQTFGQDPLGLVGLAAQAKNTGALAVKLVGGIGVVGYLALYLMRPDFTDRNIRLFAPFCSTF